MVVNLPAWTYIERLVARTITERTKGLAVPERLPSAELEADGRHPRGLVVEITPLGAFAAGALVVAALALALTLGRRMPLEPAPPPTDANSEPRLDEVRLRPPVRFDTLEVDRGE